MQSPRGKNELSKVGWEGIGGSLLEMGLEAEPGSWGTISLPIQPGIRAATEREREREPGKGF